MGSNPVIFLNAPRSCYRPVFVAEGEWYNTCAEPVESSHEMNWRPKGPYSVPHLLANMPNGHAEPSLVVCQWCCEGKTAPQDLKGVKCPKVLLVGDTHHMERPITRAIQLALSEPWDLVVLEFNSQHLHWFHEAGVKNAVYIPCFSISPIDIPPPRERTRGVTFCGNVGRDHVHRQRVIQELIKRGIKVEVFTGISREACAKIYNESLVSLNISLNGDFNLRNYEVMAAGGFLMSAHKRAHTTAWKLAKDVESAVADIDHVMKHPDLIREVAASSYHWYWSTNSPRHKIEALRELVFDTPQVPNGTMQEVPSGFWDRLSIYERVQEFILQGRIKASDICEFPRWLV